jgi:periplasmic copper chaperone A
MITSGKRISTFMLVLCLPVAAATLTALASIALGGQPSISVEHAWSRATPVGANVAVGYFTIKNTGATPDRLVSITTDIASHSAIHQMSMTDSMMKMLFRLRERGSP